MDFISGIIGKLRTIVSGFIKPKDVTLPFEGLRLPSEKMGEEGLQKEPSVSEEEALDRSNDFVRKAQQMLNSQNKDDNNDNDNYPFK